MKTTTGFSSLSQSILSAIILGASATYCGGENPEVKTFDGDGGEAGTGTGGGSASRGSLNIEAGTGSKPGTGGADGGVETTGCGDGLVQPGEVCDDGNSDAGDGCSATCFSIEENFACPAPGAACVSTVKCGNGKITGQETCDDGNTKAGDGCSSQCEVETGWQCTTAGSKCLAAQCGDGVIAGNEECEDDDLTPEGNDGCSDECKLESGFACDTAGAACHATLCNDGLKEGDEPCDDGNSSIGDGCNPFCEVEPTCTQGACVSSCGDGMLLPGDNEDCDDGNSKDGDGCSSSCQLEAGFVCSNVSSQLPATLEVPIVYRDFIRSASNGSTKHPDFESFGGSHQTPGLAATSLGADGKPVYTGICDAAKSGPCPYGQQTSTQTAFDQWYNTTANVNLEYVQKLSLAKQANGTYYFPDSTFFPLDGKGWVAANEENASDGHNFGFTSEIRTWFEFKGDETLSFSGDDDVWVFVAGKLALDLGGLHPKESGQFVLDSATAQTLGLTVGKVYEIALFHAERHTNASNFNLTLGGFVKAKSSCASICGDGIVAGDELCDDMVNDGSYGSCTADCQPGPTCGDGVVDAGHEDCDDGVNLTPYQSSQQGCAPGCKLPSSCGDGKVDSLFGEQCDDGTAANSGGYGACKADCNFGPRCGDGKIDATESCDDGNSVSGDGCSKKCKLEGPA